MKNSEDFRVNKTRPIPLKKADTNENAERMAKDASSFAHQYYLLADEQYSKLHGAAIHLTTDKCLIYDISSQIK